jgi:glycosyltransferase involved in cell wall biosynthesis
MRNVLFAADFPIAKSGIASTASSILAEDAFGPARLFATHPLTINDAPARPVEDLGNEIADLIFTHTEYSGLPVLQKRYPDAIFHVGDWPLRHWGSVRRVQWLKGTLATLRCLWRLNRIHKHTRLAFVTEEDRAGAIAQGFSNALHLPIGVRPPIVSLADRVDIQSVCFSGNFRYPPNRDAAQRLLRLTETSFPDIRVILVGFYADDFKQQAKSNVEIHPDVPSVVDFLAARRAIYVSLIGTGAGAKNKILEAMVAGCPIICTPESLDASIPKAPSIEIVSSDDEVVSRLQKWILAGSQSALTRESSTLADDTRAHRSWRSVAGATRALLSTRP